MSSTYASIHYHFVFATRNRARLISKDWRDRLYAYIAGIFKDLGGHVEQIGGIEDHIHILAQVPTNQTIADTMRHVKRNSSIWVHNDIGCKEFGWQDGYAVITVSPSSRTEVREYIRNQEAHHQVKTFREELVAFLEKIGIQYDPKYLD